MYASPKEDYRRLHLFLYSRVVREKYMLSEQIIDRAIVYLISSSILTYLLIRRYNRFAVLACLRSVRNRSRSRAFVFQSVIPALMADASTPSCHLNLGLPRLFCPCGRIRHRSGTDEKFNGITNIKC